MKSPDILEIKAGSADNGNVKIPQNMLTTIVLKGEGKFTRNLNSNLRGYQALLIFLVLKYIYTNSCT